MNARPVEALEEFDIDDEAGPSKESLGGIAQNKRTAKRKARRDADADDTDLVDDVRHIEEDLELEEEDGIKLEAFNLKEERQRGHFDEAGNYVENERDEDDDGTDAWLASDEAKVLDEKTRKRIEERQRVEKEEAAAAAANGPMTVEDIARLQWQVASLLTRGETVARALKRLRGGSDSNQRHRQRLKKKKKEEEETMTMTTAMTTTTTTTTNGFFDKEKFDRLTELTSELVIAGESEIYSQEKEYLERCAMVYVDVDVEEEDGALKRGVLAQGVATTAYEDADEDMFAEDDDQEEEKKKKIENENDDERKDGAKEEGVAYSSWSIKELRKFLTDRAIDPTGIIEKRELVEKVKEASAAGVTAQVPTQKASGAAPPPRAPPGYSYDPSTQMWFSRESNMYWDSKSGGFYNPSDQLWYSYDATTHGWVEWK